MILQILVFLVVLSILVLVHEFGHFIVGRWAKIGIVEFALGLPFTRSLISKKLKSGLTLSFYPVLFGGFVSLLGEDATAAQTESHTPGMQFWKATPLKRFLVVIAGVTMNAILAVVVFYLFLIASGFQVAIPQITDYQFHSPHQQVTLIHGVQEDSPADKAGLKTGDLVLTADGQTFAKLTDFQNYIKSKGGQQVVLEVSDFDFKTAKRLAVTPRQNPAPGEGALGVGIGDVAIIKFDTLPEKVFSGITYTMDMAIYNVKVIGFFIGQAFKTGNVGPVADNLSGPIGIFNVVGDIVGFGGKEAVIGLLNLLGVMSLSLALMNILPIPALDGGKLFLIIIEGLTGKKLSPKKETWVTQAGMAFLLGLIVLVSFNDVMRFFRR